MKISNDRMNDSIYINAQGKGKYAELKIFHTEVRSYTTESINIILDLEESKEFLKAFQNALNDLERRSSILEEEDD